MNLRYFTFLSWLLGACVMVAGLVFDRRLERLHWIPSALLVCAGCFILFGTLDALRSNQVSGQFWTASRESGPFSFWCSIVFRFILALSCFAGAVAVWQ